VKNITDDLGILLPKLVTKYKKFSGEQTQNDYFGLFSDKKLE